MSTSTLDRGISRAAQLVGDSGELPGIGEVGRALHAASDLADSIHRRTRELSSFLLAELQRLGVNVDHEAARKGYRPVKDGDRPSAVPAIIECHYWLDRAQTAALPLHVALHQARLALAGPPEQAAPYREWTLTGSGSVTA